MKKELMQGIKKLAKHLDVEFGYSIATHNFEYGIPLENALKNYYSSYFPKRYTFGSGYLIDSRGEKSNQSDWIIYDSIHFSPLFGKANREDSIEYLPFESAFGIIEVKRTLTTDSLEKAINQITITKELKRSQANPSFINPLISINKQLKHDVSDIVTNELITAIYAYSIDKEVPSEPDKFIDFISAKYSYEKIPDIIAIHGRMILVKTIKIENEIDNYKFSCKASERNSLSCKNTSDLTSGYFYTFILTMLQNTILSAKGYNDSLESIIKDFGQCYCKKIL